MQARAPLPAPQLVLLMALFLTAAGADTVHSAADSSQGPSAPRARATVAAERRGWVPLNLPCPTCRRSSVVPADSTPQGAAIVGRAIAAPPQFQQQTIQQQFLQPFQQQLLLNQHTPFAAAPGPSIRRDPFYALRPLTPQSQLNDLSTAANLPPLPSALESLQTASPRPVSSSLPPNEQISNLHPPPREEVQLLYVPIEALRGRVPPPLQTQPLTPQRPDLIRSNIQPHLLQTQSSLLPHPSSTALPTTTPSTTTSLPSTTPLGLTARHRFRGATGPALERSRYLEQTLPPPIPSASSLVPSSSVSPSSVTTPTPHQPPLSIFVGRSSVGLLPNVADVIQALRGSHSIAVMDEPGPGAPDVFVGPANLPSPIGFSKFDLPYLSTIMSESRGARRIDQLPFFVAPLSFRPPPGYSKIPFPAPHVGSVVVANSTHSLPLTTTEVLPSVSLPVDLPPISAELPSLVNSLQDHRSTGNVLLLPNQNQQNLFQQQNSLQQQKKQHSFAQQQNPILQQQTVDFRQSNKPSFTQHNRQHGKSISFQTQQPDIYDHGTQYPIDEPVATNPPPLFNRHEQQQIEQFQQEYLQPHTQKPVHRQLIHHQQTTLHQHQEQPVLRQQSGHRQQKQQSLHREQESFPLQKTKFPPQQRHYHSTPRQPHQDQVQHQVLSTRHPAAVHEENYPVTQATPHDFAPEKEEALNAGLHTLHAGVATVQRETDIPETTTTTTTSTTTGTTGRRQHFRGRQRASTSFSTESGSVSSAPEPTRRPAAGRSRRPVHSSRVKVSEDGGASSDDGGTPTFTSQRNQHRFRSRGTPRTTTPLTTTTTTTNDPTTLPNEYDIGGETTPAYQGSNTESPDFGSDKTYSEDHYKPDIPQRSTYNTASERPVSQKRRPSYSETEENSDYATQDQYGGERHSSTTRDGKLNAEGKSVYSGESDTRGTLHQRQQVDVAADPPSGLGTAQFVDGADYRQYVTSERTPETTYHPEIDNHPSVQDIENVTPTAAAAADVTSMEPPANPGTFTRTRGRKTLKQLQQQQHSESDGERSHNTQEAGAPSPVTYRPTQTRQRGRVRAQSARPRAPPEPENYPPNFHDAAIFDATRRPAAGDYSYEPQAPSTPTTTTTTTTTESNASRAPTFRQRGSAYAGRAATARRPTATTLADDATESPSHNVPDRVYTVRPTRRPLSQQARVTSVRGRIRRPTTTAKTTTEAITTTTDALPSAPAAGFQTNEVLQRPSVALPDYYDYLASDPAQDSSGLLMDFRRPFTTSYEDDDPEAGGAESQWTNKWQQGHPNALPTEPIPSATDLPMSVEDDSSMFSLEDEEAVGPSSSGASVFTKESSTTSAPTVSPATPTPLDDLTAPGADAADEPPTVPTAAATTTAPEVTASATGSTAGSTASAEGTTAGGGAPERKQRRLRVRVRTRVNLRDMLEPAESQHVATLANAIPSVAAKTSPITWPEESRESSPPVTESLDAVPAPTSTNTPPTEALAETTLPPVAETTPETTSPTPTTTTTTTAHTTPTPTSTTTLAPPTPIPTLIIEPQTTTSSPVVNATEPDSKINASKEPNTESKSQSIKTTTEEPEIPTTMITPVMRIVVNNSRKGIPSRQALPVMEDEDKDDPEIPSTTPEPVTLAPSSSEKVETTSAPTVTPTVGAKQYSDIQRVRGVTRGDITEDATMRLLGTSTTTEVSHETEICYRGRCVKTKTQPDQEVDAVPAS